MRAFARAGPPPHRSRSCAPVPYHRPARSCHGAGRASSRAKARRTLSYEEVLEELRAKGITIRVASPKLIAEEAPSSYKSAQAVVDTCHEAGISNKVLRLRPLGVVKG